MPTGRDGSMKKPTTPRLDRNTSPKQSQNNALVKKKQYPSDDWGMRLVDALNKNM